MRGCFLHAPERRVRRAASVVYAVATGLAVAVWFQTGGWVALDDRLWLRAAGAVLPSVLAWWIAAGMGLRLVRAFDRRAGDVGASR